MSEDWDVYAEAVAALGRVPELAAERRRVIAADEHAAVTAARTERDAELRRCDEWAALARRAVTTGEAHLVAAHVLIPDTTPAPPAGTPAELADDLRAAEDELRHVLTALVYARRTAAREEADAAARAAARAARRRQLLIYAGLALTLILLLLLGYVAAR